MDEHAASNSQSGDAVRVRGVGPGTFKLGVRLADASRLFEHGTMEERKRVIRAFVEGLTIDGSSQSGELRTKKLPAPELASTGSSFEMVAGVRYEAQQRNYRRETEVVRVSFTAMGSTFIPAGAAPVEDGAQAGARMAAGP